MESYRCPVCGNPISAYTAYCVHCGTRLSWQTPTIPAHSVPPQHHGGGGAVIALVLIGLLALAAIAGGYLASPTVNSLVDEVRSIYNYIRCGASTCGINVPTVHNATYDQQIAFIYGPDYSYLSTNVHLVEQNDTDGFGPSYLLNGLSSAGYWYQVGVSYNWPLASGQSYSAGVHFAWEVFTPSGSTTAPVLTNLSGPVNNGDNIYLSISFSGGNVIMAAHDNNTGAAASHSYSAFGASMFYGRNTVNNSKFFTGLMTEWYHGDPAYVTMAKVAYTGQGVSSATVCIDEFRAVDHQLVYGRCSFGTFTLTNTFQTYSYQGLNVAMTISEFDTGPS